MGAVRFRAAVELRRHWRGSVALAVLTGIGGGLALATFAGARRTDTALDRFVAGAGQQADATVNLGPDPNSIRAIAKLPHVTRTATVTVVFLRPPGAQSSRPDSISSVVLDDPGRPFLQGAIVVAGRVPDAHAPAEVAIDEVAARRRGWHVGDRLRFGIPTPEEAFGQSGRVGSSPNDPTVDLTVTAIVRLPQDLEPVGSGIEQATFRAADDLWLTPAFLGAHPDTANFAVGAVWLAHGPAGLKAFTETVRSSGGRAEVSPASQDDASDVIADTERAIHVQANALRVAAALAIAAVLFAAGLALSRQIRTGGSDRPTLRALGMTDRQQAGVGMARGAVVALIAATVALLTAIALSASFPVGFARRAEADLGMRLDIPAFAAGVLVIVVTLVAWSAFSARRSAASDSALPGTDAPAAHVRAARLRRSINNSGAPVTAVVGVGMALDSRRGRGAVPVRAAVATMTVVVAAVVGALVFATSLTHLVSTPSLQGWRWDVLIMGSNPHRIGEKLAGDRTSAAVADAVLVPVRIEGHPVATLAFRPIGGGGSFSQIVDGRTPAGPRDVALGAKTMRTLGVSIGDRVTAAYDDGSRRRTLVMLVVGRAVMPSALGFPGMALADGALTTDAAFAKLGVRSGQDNVLAFVVARFSPGTDIAAHATALGHSEVISASPRSAEVEDLRRVGGVPWLVVGLLGAVAAATITDLLLTTVRRRRRDLALLRTLGFRRRQVVSTVVWQASTVTVASIVAGIPLGVVAGRWAWNAVARSLGVSASAVAPVVTLFVMAAGTLLLAIAVTAVPAWFAAPTRPAVVLHSE